MRPGRTAVPPGTALAFLLQKAPRISKAFLDEELKATGSASFHQEYLCEFAEDGRRMFNPDLLRAALRDIEPLHL